MKQLITLILILFSANSWSSIYIDCDNNLERVYKLPDFVSPAMHVSCTSYGQIIEANKNWAMINLMSQTAFFIPSQISMDPKKKGNRSYFKTIQSRQLSQSEISNKYQFINNAFEQANEIPKRGVVITLNNNLYLEQKMYIFDNSVSYLCSPICKEGNIFLLVNSNKRTLYSF